MTSCPTYVARPSFQLGAGVTGPVDCLAHATAVLIRQATCGHISPGGRTIRLLSSEPVPDRSSPGLSIPQVADVATEHYGVFVAPKIAGQALDWDEYEDMRKDGRPLILQVGYAPIARSKYDAGRGFHDNHGMAETQHSTYDPLADGRPGAWKHNGVVYPRALMREAASALSLGGGVTVPNGKVWAGVARDTVPDYQVSIHPAKGRTVRSFRQFHISAGVITGTSVERTKGFSAFCTTPRAFRWPLHDNELRYLVRLTTGSRAGMWVSANWAEEIK